MLLKQKTYTHARALVKTKTVISMPLSFPNFSLCTLSPLTNSHHTLATSHRRTRHTHCHGLLMRAVNSQVLLRQMDPISGLVRTSVDLFKLLDASYKKFEQLPEAVTFIQSELRSIEEVINQSYGNVDQHGTSSSWIADLKIIRQRIEDAVDLYNYKVIFEDDDPGFVKEAYQAVKTLLGPRRKLIKDIDDIKKLVAEAKDRRKYQPDHPQAGQAVEDRAYQHANEANPHGLKTSKEDLLQILGGSSESSSKLRVIAISGLGGSGKTVLAKAVCNQVYKQFNCYSWVSASTNVQKILKDIRDNMKMVTPPPTEDISVNFATGSSSEDDISDQLRRFLENMRYIIRIDDLHLETGFWNNILCSFPDNGKGSRVIVTTTNDKLARRCSLNCRVHRMQPLDKGSARDLLERGLPVEHRCPDNLDQSLEIILKSCEYHPLAIVNMAGYIKDTAQGWEWDHDNCERACNYIGNQLVNGTGAFIGMSRVLNRTYSSLNYNTMNCLLSLSTYPKNHVIGRKSLIRRWLAEGLITCRDQRRSDEDILKDCFTDLVDHNFIFPIKISISGEVKTFRVHQMVLQFIKAKAGSENFVTWIDLHEGKKREQANNVCRMYLHNNSPRHPGIGKKVKLSLVRSLTFSGQTNRTLMNFRKFKLLRVLDLESCKNLEDGNLDTVCQSSMLKYLSIRGNRGVSKLPQSIVKLRQLETIDIRDTGVKMLTMEVVQLPELAHLFGEFQITCKNSDLNNLETVLKGNKSNLQTLEGLCIDESPEVAKILPLMPKLMKIKIFSRRQTAPSSQVEDDLLLSLKKCFQKKLYPWILSIDFGDVCHLDFLHQLEVSPTFISSLKLRGKFMSRGLPKFILSDPLSNRLKELCLSGTNLGCSILLKLHVLQNLQFLKLTEDCIVTEAEEIVCESGWFMNLKRLCFEVTMLPKIVIQEKAMRFLKSLQLFCPILRGFSGIENLLHLEELVLPSYVIGAEADELSQQVSRHPMRPKFNRPAPDGSRRSGRTMDRSRRIPTHVATED